MQGGYHNTFYLIAQQQLQQKKSKTKIRQSTAPINMKLTRVTPAGLEVFGEVPTAFEFLVSEPPSQKNSNGNFKLYIKISHCYLP